MNSKDLQTLSSNDAVQASMNTIMFQSGVEDAARYPKRHIDDLCQTCWSEMVFYCHNKLLNFSEFYVSFAWYRKGILKYRKATQ
jgi:hypothetical protein